ncbi:uncharacterized protein BP01DRAFT_73956 [Aspergillus saccharolyticus JOP 1030-1]|uniref:Uncharacterized protein n=1 Tax=Aspergillus saccharolyticus JOP 1030-1 TaxID=1450539 RepID=A0A318ZRJ8_9EURO|nr:hypothetical protein BP01DRAFT_73956 [Aspergillus saccharolyticus JOP 1030-1]PYH49224.1 hypothetical protein BP01DRAFT_73956 [Aspergillus saccharolyticus JOP 1030-1]
MKQAIEQAGSLFTGWTDFCSFCLSSGDDESFHHQQALQRKGAEREMKICHTQQPRLVPPMKPLAYDADPIPRPLPRASTLPAWMVVSKNRASMSLKRKSTAPMRISAPSDFRRVSSFLPGADEFSPLELSFNVPGRQLPDLPHFDDFPLETDRRSPIARPPRALPGEKGHLSQPRAQQRPSSSFQLPRKPVGSGSRRSSLGAHEYLNAGDRQTSSSSPFIPHFSSHDSATTSISTTLPSPNPLPYTNTDHRTPLRRPNHEAATAAGPAAYRPPRTPTRSNWQERPLPSIPTEEDTPPSSRSTTSPSSLTSPSDDRDRTPPRAGRVTQWPFQATSPNKSQHSSSPSTPSWLQSALTSESLKGTFRIRSRTLSGSTLASSISNLTGGFSKHPTPSLSSNTTVAAAAATTFTGVAGEKETKGPILGCPFALRQPDDRHIHPTIFESEHHQQQQQQHHQPAREQQEYEELHAQYYENYRHSAVGLAF